MFTPHPARSDSPSFPDGVTVPSDEVLAARLSGVPDAEVSQAAALLLARHWPSAHAYAAICLATSANVAAMVTTAACHQVLDRLTLGDAGVALRPRLLVTVRDTVRHWSAEDRISTVLPELRKPAGGRGMRAAKSMTPENRKLAERAFQQLPGPARCLLWHTEVEAEPLDFPAMLLGMDADTAAITLAQAREKFREGCVRAHQQLAPSPDCRFYNRLLDVPIRRGGALLPDVQDHLAQCRHCRDAAEQLGLVETGLGALLAEAVLGWGARRYLDSRPGRNQHRPRGRGGRRAGRARMLPRLPSAVVRSSRALRTGVGIASAGLLATVLATSLSYDGDADPTASAGAPADRAGTTTTPPDTARVPGESRQTRIRNTAGDLCLDIQGEPQAGAAVEPASCSAEWTQQWSYENDGLLRSVADPGLCLDSRADAGVVILGECADADDERGDDVRYDLTVQGEFLPRWDEQLALAPTTGEPGADIVVKVRDGSASQRWFADADSQSDTATTSATARTAGLPAAG
ncbi:RICIN domain-containing protein [Streptomyces sp. NPDC059868]|uniref:RICIN domain-containing protein n=1 Tax=unclassified Streptomyces TaxID=2593676 RepID=UPI000939FC33|nr:hydrolase [Streptomyces sp. TSRI0107]